MANVVAFVSIDNKHFSNQVKIRLTSQLVKYISEVFQKLRKHFNGIIISTSVVPPSAVFPVFFCLFKFNQSTVIISSYCYILLNYTLALLHQCLQYYLLSLALSLFISLMQSVLGAQFLIKYYIFIVIVWVYCWWRY